MEELKEKGLLAELGLDPREEAQARLELAAKYFEEACKLLEKRDAVQPSEKLYRVAEESVKAVALALDLEEAREARSKGRWTLGLLDRAAEKLAQRVDKRVYDDWGHAYFLHIEGFHEARLAMDRVKARVEYVKELLGKAREVLEAKTD